MVKHVKGISQQLKLMFKRGSCNYYKRKGFYIKKKPRFIYLPDFLPKPAFGVPFKSLLKFTEFACREDDVSVRNPTDLAGKRSDEADRKGNQHQCECQEDQRRQSDLPSFLLSDREQSPQTGLLFGSRFISARVLTNLIDFSCICFSPIQLCWLIRVLGWVAIFVYICMCACVFAKNSLFMKI